MSNFEIVTEWVKGWEGWLSSDKNDAARFFANENALKYGRAFVDKIKNQKTGELFHTSKGITLETWFTMSKTIGYDAVNDIDTWLNMPQDLWLKFWKLGYWDKVKADEFSAGLGSYLAHYAWGSGVYHASCKLQEVLKIEFGQKIIVDGIIGVKTIEAAKNAGDEINILFALHRYRQIFLLMTGQARTFFGWFSQIDELLMLCFLYDTDKAKYESLKNSIKKYL